MNKKQKGVFFMKHHVYWRLYSLSICWWSHNSWHSCYDDTL